MPVCVIVTSLLVVKVRVPVKVVVPFGVLVIVGTEVFQLPATAPTDRYVADADWSMRVPDG